MLHTYAKKDPKSWKISLEIHFKGQLCLKNAGKQTVETFWLPKCYLIVWNEQRSTPCCKLLLSAWVAALSAHVATFESCLIVTVPGFMVIATFSHWALVQFTGTCRIGRFNLYSKGWISQYHCEGWVTLMVNMQEHCSLLCAQVPHSAVVVVICFVPT